MTGSVAILGVHPDSHRSLELRLCQRGHQSLELHFHASNDSNPNERASSLHLQNSELRAGGIAVNSTGAGTKNTWSRTSMLMYDCLFVFLHSTS